MFIGREKELESLQTIYEKDGFGMTVIYGRRRVGKSFLISEFIKGKKAIFYTATKVGAERNLELFSKQVFDVLDPAYSNATFPNIESVLDIITSKASSKEEKLILVIDELPYWAEKDDALNSLKTTSEEATRMAAELDRIYRNPFYKMTKPFRMLKAFFRRGK